MCGIDGTADVLMGRRSEMPYMKRKGNIMLYGWKAKRHLALYVSIVLSCGGGYSLLAPPHAYSADVTGGNVVVDATHSAPTPTAAGNAHDIPGATDNRNVTGNTLTVNGILLGIDVIGGYTLGTGDATHNEIIIENGAYLANNNEAYGGWSANGNATYNTVTLNGVNPAMVSLAYLSGGRSGNASADVTTGNTLQIKNKDNGAYAISNFEKMKFVLGSGIASGDTMLTVSDTRVWHWGTATTRPQTFDWGNIEVENAETWGTGAGASKRVTLYTGPALTLNNYDITSAMHTADDFEYGLSTNTATPTASSVSATKIYFDRNQFKNGNEQITSAGAGLRFGGTSTMGNTTTKNKLKLSGAFIWNGDVIGGYTQSQVGDATHNEIIIENGAYLANNNEAYGGWSANGNVTYNTVTLNGVNPAMVGLAYLSGGRSGNASADVTTGNTLQIKNKDNGAYAISNFEKMKFVLGSGIASGDTMLTVSSAGSWRWGTATTRPQTYDWKNITVTGLSD